MYIVGNWYLANPHGLFLLVEGLIVLLIIALTQKLSKTICLSVLIASVFAAIAMADPQLRTPVMTEKIIQHHFEVVLDGASSMGRSWTKTSNTSSNAVAKPETTYFRTFRDAISYLAHGRQVDTMGLLEASGETVKLAAKNSLGNDTAEAIAHNLPGFTPSDGAQALQDAIIALQQMPPEHRVLVVFSDGDGAQLGALEPSGAHNLITQLKNLHADLFVVRPDVEQIHVFTPATLMRLAGAQEMVAKTPEDVERDIKLIDLLESPREQVLVHNIDFDAQWIFASLFVLFIVLISVNREYVERIYNIVARK